MMNSIAIGDGARAVDDGETVIGSGLNELRFKANGDIYHGGRLLTNDVEIVNGLRKTLLTLLDGGR